MNHPPSSKISERAVIGKIFVDPDLAPAVVGQLSSADFYYGKHRSIWVAIEALVAEKMVVDASAVYDRCKETSVTAADIADLHSSECTAANLDTHVRTVQQLSAQRRLVDVARCIVDRGGARQDSVPNFLTDSLKSVIDATSASVTKDPVQIGGGITDVVNQFYDQNPARLVRVATGIRQLDELTGGLINEQLNLIVARPSHGKTTVLSQIADELAKSGPVLWFSFEETIEQLQSIFISRRCGIPYHNLQLGRRTEQSITLAAAEVAQLPIYVIRDRVPVESILQRSLAFLGRHRRVSGVVVDHAALIPYRGKADGFRAQYEIFTSLSAIPGQIGCPLIVAHQLNRSAQGRAPTMADLRDAGEEPAKMIVGLYRPSLDDDTQPESELQLHITKNKGPTGKIILDVDVGCARI